MGVLPAVLAVETVHTLDVHWTISHKEKLAVLPWPSVHQVAEAATLRKIIPSTIKAQLNLCLSGSKLWAGIFFAANLNVVLYFHTNMNCEEIVRMASLPSEAQIRQRRQIGFENGFLDAKVIMNSCTRQFWYDAVLPLPFHLFRFLLYHK